MVSANALWSEKSRHFRKPSRACWRLLTFLDSAGYSRRSGYPWSIEDYVEFVVRGDGVRPSPWIEWSAMDRFCEPTMIRSEILGRVDQTADMYGMTLDALDYWSEMGPSSVQDPVPVLQGRRPDDYVRCLDRIEAELLRAGRTKLPDTIGIGSVSGRKNGLFLVLKAVHERIPLDVRIHAFGVKGLQLRLLNELPRRWSIDSMVWDHRARRRLHTKRLALVRDGDVQAANALTCTTEFRAECMREWVEEQGNILDSGMPTKHKQLKIFGGQFA